MGKIKGIYNLDLEPDVVDDFEEVLRKTEKIVIKTGKKDKTKPKKFKPKHSN